MLILVSKMCEKKWGTNFPVKHSCRKTGLTFQTFRCSRKFSSQTTQKIVLFLLSNRHFRKLFVKSERVFRQGTLQDLVRDNGPLEEPLVVKFTRQLLSAVDFLHTNLKNPIVHQDIKG